MPSAVLIPFWLDAMETLQPRRDPFRESIASLDPCRTLCKPAGPWAGRGLQERKGHGCGSRIRSRFSGNPSCEKLLSVPTGCRVPCVLDWRLDWLAYVRSGPGAGGGKR